MNLEKFVKCSKNLTDTELKDIRNYINRELNRRSRNGKPVFDPKNPHRGRTFYFMDRGVAESFFEKYQSKHIVCVNGIKDRAFLYFRSYPYFADYMRNAPEEWKAKVILCLDMTTFKEIKSIYKLSKYKVEKLRSDGSKHYYSPDDTYIVEGVENE